MVARLFVWFAFPLRLGLPAATTVVVYERSFNEARFFRIDLMPFKQLRQSFIGELTKGVGGERRSPALER